MTPEELYLIVVASVGFLLLCLGLGISHRRARKYFEQFGPDRTTEQRAIRRRLRQRGHCERV